VVDNYHTREEKIHVMNGTISSGAQGKDEDMIQVLDYLRENFGLEVNVNIGEERDLTKGPASPPRKPMSSSHTARTTIDLAASTT
jgi:hypothetical protein